MFAFQRRMSVTLRAVLIAVILFNALAPTAASAHSSGQNNAIRPVKGVDNEPGFSLPTEETFEDASKSLNSSAEPISSTIETELPRLSLSSDPDFLTPSGRFKLRWEINGVTIDNHPLLLLQITLPAGVSIEGNYDGEFDPLSRVLSVPVISLNGQVHLKAEPSVQEAVITAVLIENTNILTTAELSLVTHEQFIVDRQGGTVEAQGGKIKIHFPKDVFSQRTVIAIGKPSGDEVPSSSLGESPFQINAYIEQTQEPVETFDRDITISVNYADMGIPEARLMNLFLYWYNPETEEWEALPSSANPKTKTVTGTTDHFSVFNLGLNNWQAARTPTVDNFQVSQFTGAGTFSLPIEAPPGPGGLQPSLALTYNSQVVDQASFDTQASWVGMGWSLETGSIEINTAGTEHEFDDTYFLNVGGVSTRLVRDQTITGLYHAADENFWKFEYDSTAKTWTVWDKTGTKYYFEQKISLRYLIDCDPGPNGGGGDASDPLPYKWVLTKVKNIYNQELTYTYATETKVLHGEHYNGLQNCVAQDYSTDTAIYPESIIYPNGRYRIYFDLEDRPDYPNGWVTDAAHHSFERQRLKNIFIQYASNGTFGDPTTNSSQTVKVYRLTYESDPGKVVFPGRGYVWSNGRVSTLSKVEELGVGGAGILPAHTFVYGDKLHLTRAENGYSGAVEFDYDSDPNQILYEPWVYETATVKDYTILNTFGATEESCTEAGWTERDANSSVFVDCENPGRSLLVAGQAIQSGLLTRQIRPGGKYRITTTTTLTAGMNAYLGALDGSQDNYSLADNTSGEMIHTLTLPANASQLRMLAKITGGSGHGRFSSFKIELLPTFYRVAEKRVSDGQGNTYTYSYGYQGAAVNDSNHSDVCAPGEMVNGHPCTSLVEAYSEFRGHSQVTEIAPGGRKTVTTFGQTDALKGQPSNVLVSDNATGNKLTEVIYSAQTVQLPMYFLTQLDRKGFGHYWVFPTSTETILYNGDANNTVAATTRSQYTYSTTSPYNYGNLTSQTDQFLSGGAWVDYRSTSTGYNPKNTGDTYLVGLPAYQNMFDGNGQFLGQTFFFYDSHLNHSEQPTTGILTDIRTSNSSFGYSHIRYGYDAWGNRTSATTYSGYGAGNTNTPPDGGQTTYTCFGAGGTVGGTACANDNVHAFPLWSKNPLGHETTWTYDYMRAAPLTETDPNGNLTSAVYDNFARMTKLIRPGDDAANPTLWIFYNDTVQPFRIDLQQRMEGATYQVVRKYYDGMGRLLQNRLWNVEVNGQNLLSVVNYAYDANGQVTKQTAPFTLSLGSAYAADFSQPYTTTTYDALGRPKKITAPNGNQANYSYTGLLSAVTDAKGYATSTETDRWGRVIKVTPPTGPAVGYVYDVKDQLTKAIRSTLTEVNACLTNPATGCPASKTVSIQYDGAGRKVSMTDPDMGYWTYSYDALGNLTRQKDAKNQWICLYYDALNRLTGKHYRSDDNCAANPPFHVAYAYDQGTNGKGQRTSMTDSSGSTSWMYDVRGRMSQETKTINGAGSPFVTSWLYNSADLPITMTYPDGEELTYTYLNDGTLDTIMSSLGQVYLNDVKYDEARRITSMDYGSSILRKTFNYFDWNEPVNGGMLETAVTTRMSGSVNLQSLAYTYDENANVETITDTLAGPQVQTFGYDALNRLTSAGVTGGTNGLYNETYTYNASTGNLASKAGINYTYDSAHPHAVGSLSNGYSYLYDANGNMTDRNLGALTFDLAYDNENRLVSVTGNGVAPTATAAPSQTPPPPATATNTSVPSSTPTKTNTPAVTPTFTSTATATPVGPTATPSATPSPSNTPSGPTATFTPTATATQSSSDLIFADGFESGDLSAWTSSTTDAGDLSASSAALLQGSFGMQAVIDDTAGLYVTDDSPNSETRYRARFYFDPNSITMTSGDTHYLFKGYQGTSTEVIRVEFRQSSGNYEIRAGLIDNGTSWSYTSWFTLSDASHSIEWDWRAASNGGLTLWIDGVQQADVTDINNVDRRMDRARLGPLSGLDAGTSGTYYFDSFESRRVNYIGPIASGGIHLALSGVPSASRGTQSKRALDGNAGRDASSRDHFASYQLAPPQQSGTAFTPVADAYAAGDATTTNYGTSTTLRADNSPDLNSYLRFDVQGLTGNVTSATLRIYANSASSVGYDLYAVSDNTWTETGITYSNAPAMGSQLGSSGAITAVTWTTVDVTAYITGNGAYNFAFSTTSNTNISFASREGANAPELVIETSTGGATNTPTATATPSQTATGGPSPTPTRTPTGVVTNTPTVPPTATPTTPPPFQSATFLYDGDGKRVKSTFNGTITTYFAGAHYEVSGSTITKYYYADAQRIAMRSNGTLSYLMGDHLGSTSLTTDAAGNKVSEIRYKAWGTMRYATEGVPTRYQYTGQFSYEAEFGLYFYNARWYDPYLNHFTQPDSIIPDPYNPQDWNRYSYARYNPIRYTDPSGHRACSSDEECKEMGITPSGKDYLDFTGYSNWERRALRKLYDNGGPNAQHGVLYILENSIHITVGGGWPTLGGATGAWFDEGSNTLTLNSDVSAGSVDSNGQPTLWGLSLIIHEARHLEQGSNFSHSKLGEMDAWQVQVDVLVHFGYFDLDATGKPVDTWARSILDAQTVEAFSLAVQAHDSKYWNRLDGSGYEQSLCIGLCSYPDLPYMCMMAFGTCPPEPPWLLRLDFTP